MFLFFADNEFFADNDIIVSRDSLQAQEAIDFLIFQCCHTGLSLNVAKANVMICQPGFIKTNNDVSCTHTITGEGPTS